MWIRGSGSTITERWIRGSGSTLPKCGSQDPDPRQNEMDPKRWILLLILFLMECYISIGNWNWKNYMEIEERPWAIRNWNQVSSDFYADN